jgi:hypothetical protein
MRRTAAADTYGFACVCFFVSKSRFHEDLH